MIPIDKVKNILERYILLERTFSGKFDAKLLQKIKRIFRFKNIIKPAKEYIEFRKKQKRFK